jgi:hypothetical protein
MVCRNLTRKKAICTDRFSGLLIRGTRSSNGLSVIKISQLNLCLKVHSLGSCLSALSAFDEVRGSVSEFSSPVACDVKGDVQPIDCATVALVCCAKKVREIIIESPVREVGDEKPSTKIGDGGADLYSIGVMCSEQDLEKVLVCIFKPFVGLLSGVGCTFSDS